MSNRKSVDACPDMNSSGLKMAAVSRIAVGRVGTMWVLSEPGNGHIARTRPTSVLPTTDISEPELFILGHASTNFWLLIEDDDARHGVIR